MDVDEKAAATTTAGGRGGGDDVMDTSDLGDMQVAPLQRYVSERFQRVEVRSTVWEVPTRYKNLNQIGVGAYGCVCSAEDTETKHKVAIKKLSRPFQGPEYAKRTYRELKILHHFDNENIVCLIDAFTPQNSFSAYQDVYMVSPLMGADLNAIIRAQSLQDEHIQFLIYQIVRALKHMHSAGIVHRDLKPSNIAVNEDCELKILDFGLARQQDDEMSGYVATRWYRAPEIMLKWMHYNENVDIWSVGCIMSELITAKPLFPGTDHVDQLVKVMEVTGPPQPDYMAKIDSEDARKFILEKVSHCSKRDFYDMFGQKTKNKKAIDLMEKMLELDPEKRIGAVSALEHAYLEQYHDPNDEPTSPEYVDKYECREKIPVETWKKIVWNFLQNFEARTTSLAN